MLCDSDYRLGSARKREFYDETFAEIDLHVCLTIACDENIPPHPLLNNNNKKQTNKQKHEVESDKEL